MSSWRGNAPNSSWLVGTPCWKGHASFGYVQKDALKLTQIFCLIERSQGAPFAKGKMCHDRSAVHTYNKNAAQRKHIACACIWGTQLICKAPSHSSLDLTTAASHGLPCAGKISLRAKALNKINQQNNWLPEFTLTELQSWWRVIQSH